jgi:hypothetical protein
VTLLAGSSDADGPLSLLAHIAATMPDVAEAARQALDLGVDPANKRVFDSSKVGDHTALIPIRPNGPPLDPPASWRLFPRTCGASRTI